MTTETEHTQRADKPDSLERLRDRTDELELIISSLTIFALLSLPGWLFDYYSLIYTHLSVGLVVAGTLGVSLASGVCYALAACFIVHLMTRAFWVGLIGLRTVFPSGINWDRTPGIGPLTKAHYRQNLLNMDVVTERADRVASSLFAVISLLTLGMLWLGALMLVTIVLSSVIGAQFGATNAGLGIGSLVLLAVFAGVPALQWLLDSVLARRIPGLQGNRAFAGLIRVLMRINGIVYPQRLVLPVQLTLQSNTRPVMFYIALSLSIIAIVLLGNLRFSAWQLFTLSGQFTYMQIENDTDGFRSTYYEDMRTPKDRLRAWPLLDSYTQKGSFVSLFIPYQPLRDNLILDDLCADADGDTPPTDCLRQLWSVSINDVQVAMTGFDTAERRDLHMRGLVGLVPLSGLQPGMHRINVLWNPHAEDDAVLDDRYAQAKRTYSIPIAFTPDFERALPD